MKDLVNETNGKNVGGIITVQGNKVGCQNIPAINAACGTFLIAHGQNDSASDVIPNPENRKTVGHRMTVFPNPATDYIRIVLPREYQQGLLRMTDAQGRLIRQQEIENESLTFDFELGILPTGTYFLMIVLDGELFTEKLSIH